MKVTKAKFIRDSFNYFSAVVVSNVITLATLPVYTRFLSPSDYGIIALFTMFGGLIVGSISFGLQGSTYRYYFKYCDDMERFRSLNMGNLLFSITVLFAGGTAVWFLSGKIARVAFNGGLEPGLLMWSYVNGCLDFLLGYMLFLLLAETRSRAYSALKVVQVIFTAALSIYFLYFLSMTYMARIYAFLIAKTALLGLAVYLTRRLFAFRCSLALLGVSLRFSLPNIPLNIVGLSNSAVDKTLLSKYSGLTSVGYYNFGENLSGSLKMLVDSIEKSWSPYFMQKAKEGTTDAKAAIIGRFYDVAFLFIFCGLCIIYFAEEGVKLLATKEYYMAMYVVPLFVFHYLFGVISMLAVNQINFSEKTKVFLIPAVVSMALALVLNFVFIRLYGAMGAAAATALSSLGAAIVELYLGNRLFPLEIKKGKLAFLFLLSGAFTTPVYFLMASEINMLMKLVIKLALLGAFLGISLKTRLISIEYARSFWQMLMIRILPERT